MRMCGSMDDITTMLSWARYKPEIAAYPQRRHVVNIQQLLVHRRVWRNLQVLRMNSADDVLLYEVVQVVNALLHLHTSAGQLHPKSHQ